MRALSQENGCRVLSVGGSEEGGSFTELQCCNCVTVNEDFLHGFMTFLKGDYLNVEHADG